MKPCDWCGNHFEPAVSYQIYCSIECREESTREKILERHKILRRQRRTGKLRMCANKCGTKLSIYNDETLCFTCKINQKEVSKKIKEIKIIMKEADDES